MPKILVIGANGQLGTVLTARLQEIYGMDQVIASDLRHNEAFLGQFEVIDATEINTLQQVVQDYQIEEIYHLAAILSAKGEANPLGTWDINMKTLFNVLEVSRTNGVKKVFFPSSIAVFGDEVDRENTLQSSFLNPTTVYGISKAAGEVWGQYYFERYGLDVRSIRYPGVIGYQSLPGGGTTDYAVDIYHKAVKGEKFTCFLDKTQALPMIYMDDAIRGTIELMQAPADQIKTRTAYNLGSMSFSPEEIYQSILEIYPDFEIEYQPDFRQQIAANWPKKVDDNQAREHWGWEPAYDLQAMTRDMVDQLKTQYMVSQ